MTLDSKLKPVQVHKKSQLLQTRLKTKFKHRQYVEDLSIQLYYVARTCSNSNYITKWNTGCILTMFYKQMLFRHYFLCIYHLYKRGTVFG